MLEIKYVKLSIPVRYFLTLVLKVPMNHQYQFLILFYFELNFQEFSKTSKTLPIYWLLFWIVIDWAQNNPSYLLHNPNYQPKIVKILIFRFNIFFSKKSYIVTPNQLEYFQIINNKILENSAFLVKKIILKQPFQLFSKWNYFLNRACVYWLHQFSANHLWKCFIPTLIRIP